MFLKKKIAPVTERRKNRPMQRLLEGSYSTRTKITLFVMGTFIIAVSGIGLFIYLEVILDQAWKEILLVMLGAFIGAYQRIIDFWFNNTEGDREIIKRADIEDSVGDKETPPVNPNTSTTSTKNMEPKLLLENKDLTNC